MRILLENALNLKDLGGIPINLEQQTKYKQFLRSDLFLKINNSEVEYLVNYGLKVVIDLREESKTKNFPDVLNRKPFIYYNISLIEYTPNDLTTNVGIELIESYFIIIDKRKDKVKEVFDVFLKHPNDLILFHCFAGKDRTGIIAYLLLSIVGCPFTDILSDYIQTDAYLLPYTQVYLSKSNITERDKGYWDASKENLIRLNDYILANYGSPILYLLNIGLTIEEIQSIRERFTTSY